MSRPTYRPPLALYVWALVGWAGVLLVAGSLYMLWGLCAQ